MKRCPQCNRVETDEALAFCRVDGTALVTDTSSVGGEAGTVDSRQSSSEIETSILPHKTDVGINRATAPTTVLPSHPSLSTTGEFRITTKTRLNMRGLAVIGTAIIAAVTAAVVISYRIRSSSAAINSIAVMPFVNES